jgi:ABC-type multidrug transport system ATPase subunit
MTQLVAETLTKDYGDLVALDALDLTVDAGELVVLVGHNGSGKTTFLRMAAGLLEPSSGTVTVAGHPAGSLAARAAACYVPDNPVLYDDLDVWEHVEYTARLHGVDDWEDGAEALLERLGLDGRAEDLPVTFSRGLRQKTSLALAFVRPFRVLLVDEPFVGLDAPGQATALDLLTEAAAGGAAVVVASHQLDVVARSTRCVALRDGVVVHDGPADADHIRVLVAD